MRWTRFARLLSRVGRHINFLGRNVFLELLRVRCTVYILFYLLLSSQVVKVVKQGLVSRDKLKALETFPSRQ